MVMRDEIENNHVFPGIYTSKLSNIIFFYFAGNWLAILSSYWNIFLL